MRYLHSTRKSFAGLLGQKILLRAVEATTLRAFIELLLQLRNLREGRKHYPNANHGLHMACA